jgi:hypothetical protein
MAPFDRLVRNAGLGALLLGLVMAAAAFFDASLYVIPSATFTFAMIVFCLLIATRVAAGEIHTRMHRGNHRLESLLEGLSGRSVGPVRTHEPSHRPPDSNSSAPTRRRRKDGNG